MFSVVLALSIYILAPTTSFVILKHSGTTAGGLLIDTEGVSSEPLHAFEQNFDVPYVDSPKSLKIELNNSVKPRIVQRGAPQPQVSHRQKSGLNIDVPTFRHRSTGRKRRKNSRSDGQFTSNGYALKEEHTLQSKEGISKLVSSTQDLISNEDLLDINHAAEKEVLHNDESVPVHHSKEARESRKIFKIFNEKKDMKVDKKNRFSYKQQTNESTLSEPTESTFRKTTEPNDRKHRHNIHVSKIVGAEKKTTFATPIVVQDPTYKSFDNQFKANLAASLSPYIVNGYEIAALKDFEINIFDNGKKKDISHVLLSPISVGVKPCNSDGTQIDMTHAVDMGNIFAGSRLSHRTVSKDNYDNKTSVKEQTISESHHYEHNQVDTKPQHTEPNDHERINTNPHAMEPNYNEQIITNPQDTEQNNHGETHDKAQFESQGRAYYKNIAAETDEDTFNIRTDVILPFIEQENNPGLFSNVNENSESDIVNHAAEESKTYNNILAKEYGLAPNKPSINYGDKIIQPIIIEKEVPVTKFVDRYIEKKVPVPTPYEVVKEVPVEKPVPYPVEVEKIVEKPVHVTRYVDRHHRVEVKVPHPVPYQVPYPVEKKVYVDNPIHVPVERIVEKKVVERIPVPTPVAVPYEVKVPVEQPVLYPIPVNRPYAVHIPVEKHVERIVEKKVPYPVTVEKKVPYPVDRIVEKPVTITHYVEKKVPVNIHVPVPVPQPYPVDRYIERKVPYAVPVDRFIEKEVKVPVSVPYPVEKVVEKVVDRPYAVTKYVNRPYLVEKRVPYPVPIDRVVEKHVPVAVRVPYEVRVPYAVEKIVEKPVPYAVRVPYSDDRTTAPRLTYTHDHMTAPSYSNHMMHGYTANKNSTPYAMQKHPPMRAENYLPSNSDDHFQYVPVILQNKNKDIRELFGNQKIKTTQWGNTYASTYRYTTTSPRSAQFKQTPSLSSFINYLTNIEPTNDTGANRLRYGDESEITPPYATSSNHFYSDISTQGYYPALSTEFDNYGYGHPFQLTKYKMRRADKTRKVFKNINVEYGGFRPPMVPSVEVDLSGVPVTQSERGHQ